MSNKNIDRQIIGSVQVLSYCVNRNGNTPLVNLPQNGNSILHIIRAESLAKYVPYDVQVKTSFSKTTVVRARGSVSFNHSTASSSTTWQAHLPQVHPSDDDAAVVKCHQAASGMPVEIESLPGDITVKRAYATKAATNPNSLIIKITVS